MRKLSCTLLAAVLPISLVSAQEAGSAGSPRAQEPATSRAADPSLQEVVVTGSRIVRNGDESPSPVTVLSAEELLLASPSNIPAALNKLPIFSGQNGQSLGFAPGALSGNYLNLRDFGAA